MNPNPFAQGLDFSRETDSFALFIFGITGDLTRKKLIPALFSLFIKEHISDFLIIGFARRNWNDKKLMSEAKTMLDSEEFNQHSRDVKDSFLKKLKYIQSSFEDDKGYREIFEKATGYSNWIYYLSTPPSVYETIIERLGQNGLAKIKDLNIRLIVEKPFGRDLASANRLNAKILHHFNENQVYRIDHYLGKETVQNIMLFRFGNALFEPLWTNQYIDHIQITVAEKIGVGTRGNYYESSGALRDMVQNHMFQLLALITMEPPNNLQADSIRNEKVKILQALKPIQYSEVKTKTVRAQYSSGIVEGAEVNGYKDEDGVAPNSLTETFVAIKAELETWRWAGVPIYLRTGKRLSRKVSEISIHFKELPHKLFPAMGSPYNRNSIVIHIQPHEGITMNMNVKTPGYSSEMRPVKMDFSYGSAFGESTPEAYERLILDAIIGDSTLYTRKDEIEASWTYITRILRGWENAPEHMDTYLPGSSGPDSSHTLLGTDGRKWRKL